VELGSSNSAKRIKKKEAKGGSMFSGSMFAASNAVPIFPDLAGKVAVVTGSSRGIGAETARYLALNKVKVVVNGRDQHALDQVVSKIQSFGGEALGLTADCTKHDQIDAMRQKVDEQYGGTDLLIAFAGGGGPLEPIEELSEERWDSLLRENLTSKFLTVKCFLPGMKRKAAGSIVLMCSSAGRAVSRASLAYSSAQAGVVMLARNLAQQLGKDGIRVNAIAPSAIRNERMEKFMLSSMSKEQQEDVAKGYPIPRLGEPQDVAAATLFLCSESSSWITGVTLDVAGGKVMV
jgi:3-oxoacyl-[acyl-carrier protein] reductase